MYYDYMKSEFGIIHIYANETHLLQIEITDDVLEDIAPSTITSQCKIQLQEYFNHERVEFDLPIYFGEGFKGQVLESLYLTTPNQLLSYKDLGERVSSKAYQAIGSAMKHNKIPIIIPCHRIIKHDGSLGQYRYGQAMKEKLQLLEARTLFKQQLQETVYFTEQQINHLQTHPVLGKMFDVMPMVSSYQAFKHVFPCLVSQILYQQVAFKTAFKQETKLARECHFDITKETLSALTPKQWISLGLNGPRMKTIKRLIEANLDEARYKDMEEKAIYQELMKIKGIGSWTVEMTLLFGLKRQDIISYKDMIIVNGLKHLYKLDTLSLSQFNELIKSFKGFESIVSMNVWNYMEKGFYLNEDCVSNID